MGRIILIAMVIPGVLLLMVVIMVWVDGWSYSDWRDERKAGRRQRVLDDQLVEQAHANYKMLQRSIWLQQRVLDTDALMPQLPRPLRDDLQTLVTQFYNDEVLNTKRMKEIE